MHAGELCEEKATKAGDIKKKHVRGRMALLSMQRGPSDLQFPSRKSHRTLAFSLRRYHTD